MTSTAPDSAARSQASSGSGGLPTSHQPIAINGAVSSADELTARAEVRNGSPLVFTRTFQSACRIAATSVSPMAIWIIDLRAPKATDQGSTAGPGTGSSALATGRAATG